MSRPTLKLAPAPTPVEHEEYPLNSKLDSKARARLRRKVEAATRPSARHSSIFDPLSCEETHLGKRVFLFHDLIGMPAVALAEGVSVTRKERGG